MTRTSGHQTPEVRQQIGRDLAPVTFYAPRLDALLDVVLSGSCPPRSLGGWLHENPGTQALPRALFALAGRIEGDRLVTREPGWAEVTDRLDKEAQATRRVGAWRESGYHG